MGTKRYRNALLKTIKRPQTGSKLDANWRVLAGKDRGRVSGIRGQKDMSRGKDDAGPFAVSVLESNPCFRASLSCSHHRAYECRGRTKPSGKGAPDRRVLVQPRYLGQNGV